MPRRKPGWTRFSVRKRDQTRNLEHFHESINLGNALGMLRRMALGRGFCLIPSKKPIESSSSGRQGPLGGLRYRRETGSGCHLINDCNFGGPNGKLLLAKHATLAAKR